MHRLKAFILVLSSQRLLDPYVDKSLAVQSRKLKTATASLKGDPCLTSQTSQVAVSWTCKTFGTSNLSQLKVLKNFYGITLTRLLRILVPLASPLPSRTLLLTHAPVCVQSPRSPKTMRRSTGRYPFLGPGVQNSR